MADFVCAPVKPARKGRICVAFGCSKTTGDGVTLFSFPFLKNPNIAKQWEKLVMRRRAKWRATKWSLLCSDHFAEESFTDSSKRRRIFDPTYPKCLLPDAVPTIFQQAIPTPVALKISQAETECGCLSDRQQSDAKCSATKRKVGGAFVKRERYRTLLEIEVKNQLLSSKSNVGSDSAVSKEIVNSDANISHTYMQTDNVVQRNKKTSVRFPGKNKGLQVNLKPAKTRSIAIQCTLIDDTLSKAVPDAPPSPNALCHVCSHSSDLEEEPPSSPLENESVASAYEPSSAYSDSSDESFDSVRKDFIEAPQDEKKYIVFDSALRNLFKWCRCPKCGSCDIRMKFDTVGTLLVVCVRCLSCNADSTWKSQPSVGSFAAGNILLSSCILFAGASPSKVLRVFQHMNVCCFNKRTYFRHQNQILEPAVERVWQQEQLTHIAVLRLDGKPLVLGGDGRADSPGHSAKFGAYTLMELENNIILDVKIVQSNECGGSYHMEITGMIRAIEYLEERGLEIGTLITDRHRQIAKWIRLNRPDVKHLYDIWHFAKSINRQLKALSQQKECAELKAWVQSIVNHVYWSAVSSPPGNGALIAAKFRSIANHVQNVHNDHSEDFSKCCHGDLSEADGRKKWLKSSTKVAVQLEKFVCDKMRTNDVSRLSGCYQTARLESFHSVINQFAPKMYSFSHGGMVARLRLASLHYNENAGRQQRRNKDGTACYKVKFLKYKNGKPVVSKLLKDQTFGYVARLQSFVIAAVTTGLQDHDGYDYPEPVLTPPNLCSSVEHPHKAELVRRHRSRFISIESNIDNDINDTC